MSRGVGSNFGEHLGENKSEKIQGEINHNLSFDKGLQVRLKRKIFYNQARWSMKGEKPTRYFFAKNKSTMFSERALIDSENKELAEIDQILEEQNRFYRRLYQKNEKVEFKLGSDLVPDRITSTQREVQNNGT